AEPPIQIDFDNAGFERISDDDDTGEMFKDAYMQEAIVDRVRAVEFDIETTPEAEVGSLLSEVSGGGGFERIADEDEPAPAAPKKRGRAKAPGTEKPAKAKAAKPKKEKAPAKPKPTKSKKSKSDASEGDDVLPDAEASVKESNGNAEMAVRRGGRGRRR